MDRLVYAVFPDAVAAREAVDQLMSHGVPDDIIDVMVHEGAVREGDFSGPATMARRAGPVGGVIVGLAGATVGGIIAGLPGAGLGAIVGGLFGIIIATIAGSSEPKPKLKALTRELRRGRALVTVDLARRQVVLDCEHFFEQHGALRVGMA